MNSLNICKTHKEIINKLPEILESLISFDRFSIIILDSEFGEVLGLKTDRSYSENGLNIGRVFYNGEWLFILSVDKFICSKPQFQSINQFIAGRKRYLLYYFSHRLLFRAVADPHSKRGLFGVQFEIDKPGDIFTGKYLGFTSTDDGLLSILFNFLTQKISELTHSLTIKQKQEQYISILSLLTKLLENKTAYELITCFRDNLGKYLGYEYAGLLYYSKASTLITKNS